MSDVWFLVVSVGYGCVHHGSSSLGKVKMVNNLSSVSSVLKLMIELNINK
jgi:hypothetical protein